jgi:hypothetical protein
MNYKPLIESQYKMMCDKQIAKNEDYGNSAFEDIEVMGRKIPAIDACLSRMSDKLKRLQSRDLKVDETLDDTLIDLVGYIVIYTILKNREQ